ncbi:hypothetical protein [uncultured Flavobacterium sp.]|uniref:hypothetical protein n=1 Tax=uncultured Flavobacterium sp. TaxID=165435 RepID=UPI002931C101|nr:hypothetical protein [uncultured Flavobacterium sp.]
MKRETISKNETTDSCQKECCKENHSSKKDQHGCNGKCDHSGCTTSGPALILIAANEFEFDHDLFNFSTEKTTLHHRTASISDGFTSIWLPPKIK